VWDYFLIIINKLIWQARFALVTLVMLISRRRPSSGLGGGPPRCQPVFPVMESRPFGSLPGGAAARLYTLRLADGFAADLADLGGTLVRLLAPDRRGRLADVVLGFAGAEDYAARSPYFGCIVGRVGNRIAGGRFALDGKTYALATNNAPGGRPCHLHGGLRGFDKVLWAAEPGTVDGQPVLRLSHTSPDGDEGYPGRLDATVTYTLGADHSLRIDYAAVTDRPTPVNLTNHSYFNLRGEGDGDILGHELTLHAAHYTPADAGLIPTGAVASVGGTPLDFTTPHRIGTRIEAPFEQLQLAGGYDHNFVLSGEPRADGLRHAATARDPESGRTLETFTSEPGVQFYSGNFLDGTLTGKSGRPYPRRGGFCLETQHYPDSPNQPAFPSVILRPGQTYRSTTVYRFGAT